MPSRKQLSQLDTVFVECRGPLRHAWYAVNPPQAREGTLASRGEQHSFKCDRCGMLKHEVWSRRNGSLMTRQYVRPEGYAPIPRSFNGDALRRELIMRWGDSPPTLLKHKYNGK